MRSFLSPKTTSEKTLVSKSSELRPAKTADSRESVLPQRIELADQKSASETSVSPHKPAKRTRNRIPPPQRQRILQGSKGEVADAPARRTREREGCWSAYLDKPAEVLQKMPRVMTNALMPHVRPPGCRRKVSINLLGAISQPQAEARKVIPRPASTRFFTIKCATSARLLQSSRISIL